MPAVQADRTGSQRKGKDMHYLSKMPGGIYQKKLGRNDMFGYININRKELPGESAKAYQAYYCGLCRKLKQSCGTKGQMLLNDIFDSASDGPV